MAKAPHLFIFYAAGPFRIAYMLCAFVPKMTCRKDGQGEGLMYIFCQK